MKKVYEEYKDLLFKGDDHFERFSDAFLDDFTTFENLGIIPEGHQAKYEEVKAMLEEGSN